MGQAQKLDHKAAGRAIWQLREQLIEHAPVGVPREELGSVDQIEQSHGFAPQGMDDMMIIDDMAMLSRAVGSTPLQGHKQRTADKDIEAIIVKPDT
jgi:hypothetical protein